MDYSLENRIDCKHNYVKAGENEKRNDEDNIMAVFLLYIRHQS